MTGGKSPGWGKREVCLPRPPGCWGRFQKREVLRWGSASCGRGSQGTRTGIANQRAAALPQEEAR